MSEEPRLILRSPDEASDRRRALARSTARERQAAQLLGTRRIHRGRYERAADVDPVILPCGLTLQPEVKTRASLPTLISGALAQAAGYGPRGSVPVAILSATGEQPLIVMPLRAFRRVAGLEAPEHDPQLAIAFPDLGPDERRVLERIAHRLRIGAHSHGALDLARDPRDWTREAAEHLLDGCVRLACDAVRRSA